MARSDSDQDQVSILDDVARYNKERWEELSEAGVKYSRPRLDLDQHTAWKMIGKEGILGDVEGMRVLCLASGGGQQSAAFALLGANVTVLDLSETQLRRDREAAAHYGVRIETYQGDMRDLSRFGLDTFDVVWQSYSLSFVPDPQPVFREVARVLRMDGMYRVECANPFTHPAIKQGPTKRGWKGQGWTAQGYLLNDPYVDGARIPQHDPFWDFEGPDGALKRVKGPREFRHTLGSTVNGLVEQGFVILGLWEVKSSEPEPKPGSWEHFVSVAAPWWTFWASYRPYVFSKA